MRIKKIVLENFRSYDKLEVDLDENINVFIGMNAQGKTNLLESVYTASIGKSFRTDKDIEVLKFESEYTKIYIEYLLQEDQKKHTVEYYLGKNNKKQIKDDGFICEKIGDHVGRMNVVIFSPDNLNIIKGSPMKRRKFLDVLISQISRKYLIALQNYNKYLKIKNSLLKKDYVDDTYLDIIDEKLAEYAVYISAQRKSLIQELIPILKKIHEKITCKLEKIDIEYKSDFKDCSKDAILEKLKKSRKSEIFKKTSIIGIQKDDIDITIDNLTEEYFSQGQTRTALLSLKFSEFEILKKVKGDEPVLLLDDVFSELDNTRIQFILNYIEKYQSIITTNTFDQEKGKSVKIYNIQKGKLVEE